MRKLILVNIVLLFFYSCDKTIINKVIVDEKTGKPMLIGETDRSIFEQSDFSEWFNSEYDGYESDEFILEQIKVLCDSIDIQIFMGTWCGDSRREVPRFLKILDKLEFDNNNLQIINVDRKKHSPNSEEKDKNIEFVPTIIINQYGIEIGRIVEFPIITLEGDLYNVLLGLNL